MVVVLLENINLFLLIGKDFQYTENNYTSIMLALCLMLSDTYYAKNYAGIIGRSLLRAGY